MEGSLLALQRELVRGIYTTGEYRTFWISDPKPRLISAAPFRDRVVHHALIQVIEPIFERRFIHHSYACRTGKGNHRALRQFVKWGRAHRYVLKLDIRKFFPSIDHEILKATLCRTIKDERVIDLCARIINGSNPQEDVQQWFPGDDLLTPIERRRGIPIGNLTSQFFGNVYLDPFDHFLKEQLRVGPYLRYVDDFALFGDARDELTAHRRSIAEFLAHLRLTLNERKSRVRRMKEGIDFLGFVGLPYRLRLSARTVKSMRRRIRKQRIAYATGTMPWSAIEPSLHAWNAHAANGDTWRLRRDIYRKNTFA